MDDFGTGYSSLSSLRRFPGEFLKIDRSFVAGLGTDATRAGSSATSSRWARASACGVIAEGIETEDEAALLAELNCELVQGYLFARPLPAEQAALFLPIHGGRHSRTPSVPMLPSARATRA